MGETKFLLPESAIPERWYNIQADMPPRRKRLTRSTAVRAAAQADEEGRERTILFNLSGHGHFDLGAYDAHLAGQLEDSPWPRTRSTERWRRSRRSPGRLSRRASPSRSRVGLATVRV